MLALTTATLGTTLGATLGGPIDLLARALVLVVFTAGALAALTGLLARPVAGARPPVAQVAYASFSGIVAALLAVGLGGPGALPWLVLACLAGAATQKIEARLVDRGRGPDDAPEHLSPGTASGSLAAQVIRGGHALAVVVLTLSAGALLLAQQTSELVGAAGPVLPWAVGLGLAAATFAAVRGDHHGRGGRWLGPLTLVSLGLYVALTLSLLTAGGALGPVLSDIFTAAFSSDSASTAAGTGILAAAAQGVLRAAASGSTGGLAGFRHNQRGAWGEPLVVAAIALLTGLAAHTARLSEPTPITGRELYPLEHHLRAGLAPSEYGQLIVLPQNSGLEEGQRYRLVLRADPRGQKYGEAFRDENVVAAPAWDFTRTVDTVILRDKHPERSKNSAFDVKIPVRRELVDTRVGPFLKLHPIDPSLNFRQLMTARGLDGPFLNVADYTFEAGVTRGFHLADGARTSLVAEPRPADAPKNPQLRDFVAFNYSGPFADGPRPPLALTAPITSGLEPGSVLHLRLDTPARGLELGFVNRLGELEVPAWDFLSGTDTAVLRHNTDPGLDQTITVRSRLAFGRLRFSSPDLEFDKLAALFPDHTGPFLLAPSYHFAVEVHRGARLPAEHAETQLALIPVHPQTAPAGNPGVTTYDPHPGEVLLTGMTGPFRDHEAAGTLVAALARRFGPLTGIAGAAALLVLALASLVRWFGVGLSSARGLFGAAPEFGFGLAFLVCVALGPALGLPPLLRVVDAVAALAVLLGLARLIARLPRARRS